MRPSVIVHREILLTQFGGGKLYPMKNDIRLTMSNVKVARCSRTIGQQHDLEISDFWPPGVCGLRNRTSSPRCGLSDSGDLQLVLRDSLFGQRDLQLVLRTVCSVIATELHLCCG